MQTELGEVRPKPRHFKTRISRVEAVSPLLQKGQSRQEISEATGLMGDTLTYAIRDNYARGYVERPNPEMQRHMHRLNTSAGKGGILLAVRKYFHLDLTARQTKVALEAHDGIELTRNQIVSAYSRERHRHGLQRPLNELTVEAQRDKRRSSEELLSIAENRLAAEDLRRDSGLDKPTTLKEWYGLEETAKTAYVSLLVKILGGEEFIPRDILAKRYLTDLFNARRLWMEKGDRSLIANFPTEYEEKDPTLLDRISDQIQAVIQYTTSTFKKQVNYNGLGLAESGEFKSGETDWR